MGPSAGHAAPPAADQACELAALLAGDPARWRMLGMLRSLGLVDSWIGAGFVRNAVWGYLHGIPRSSVADDVDVIWFDPRRAEPAIDEMLEARLRELDAGVQWSVRNQARMHLRNGDAPYASATDALRFWPETATAVAVRQAERGQLKWTAPFGLDDLFGLIVRPTPHFSAAKRGIFLDRVSNKQWLRHWPRLTLAEACDRDALNQRPDARPSIGHSSRHGGYSKDSNTVRDTTVRDNACRLLVEHASGSLHDDGLQYARPFSDRRQQGIWSCPEARPDA